MKKSIKLITTLVILLAGCVFLSCDDSENANNDNTAVIDGSGGGIIAFYSDRDGNPEIYIMNADGSAETPLTDNSAHDVCPAISPDGTTIAFLSNRNDRDPSGCFPNCNYEIFLIGIDGTNERQITQLNCDTSHIDWSPDGTRLSFDADIDGDGFHAIYIINTDGTGLTQVTDDTANDYWADWSPDQTQFAFCSDRDGNNEIYIMNVDGTNQVRLTQTNTEEIFPDWSPDATMLAFASGKTGTMQVYTLTIQTMNESQLTQASTNSENPAWSPDGSKIAFQSANSGNYHIKTMDSNGENQSILTNSGQNFWADWVLYTNN